MPQLHCYIPDKLAEKLQDRAQRANLSVSKYLALLVSRAVEDQWPKGYFELFGSWQGKRLERSSQGEFENRADFE